MDTLLAVVRSRALAALVPPTRLRLSEWIGREIVPPEGTSALSGRVRLWPYQRAIADAIGSHVLRSLQSRAEPIDQLRPMSALVEQPRS
jgi:hypothetical protein